MTRISCISLPIYVILVSVLVSACGSGGPGPVPASSTAPPATNPPMSLPPTPTTQPTQPTPTASGPVPGVIDCALSYDKLYFRPAFITLACGDGRYGVEKIAWTRWGTSAALGQGKFFDNLCVPSCAAGKEALYPVQVELSGVKSSSLGAYFSQLQVTWEGARPPYISQESFTLVGPGS